MDFRFRHVLVCNKEKAMSTISVLESETASAGNANGRAGRGELDAEGLFEVIHGQRVECSMSFYAGWLNTRLTGYLAPFVRDNNLGTLVTETMFILDDKEKEQRRPEQAFLSKTTWPLDRPIPKVGELQIVPDLTVEVISPNDLFEKVLAKVDDYFFFGVKQVWVLSPIAEKLYIYDSPRQVRVLTLADELDGGTLLPGFRLKVADLFGATAGKM